MNHKGFGNKVCGFSKLNEVDFFFLIIRIDISVNAFYFPYWSVGKLVITL